MAASWKRTASQDATTRYGLEADWQLLNTCNYRCNYCFFSDEMLGEKLRTCASVQEWRAAFDATEDVWLLHMTGGEPSIYPQFVELCQALTERHYISINSNLTHSSLVDFAERIDPSRVSFINASLHLVEREGRSGNAKFLRHADLLRSKGFPIMVSLVATPTALARFPDAVALLRPVGLFPIPKLLRGPYEGRHYPTAYSELDKVRFRAYAAEARRSYQTAIARMAEPPSINMFSDDEFLEGEPSFTGVPCDAGYRFVGINPNGDVFRCSSATSLGNLLDGTFAARSGPAPCDTAYCFYFCRKYAAWTPAPPPNTARRLPHDRERAGPKPDSLSPR
jgi:MoaA/NifB/PqqE/SkfB family radical SAM enzyme